ncbi:glycosyltransferase family 4 protein [Sporosarcina saromensis]|uniref:Glycosyltransferase family 4 protein n=1 Tax=Sporosarcina saromensis TaxID=359365 RepID=A0ABU4GAM0_9BACL|nr:glycosyltransferase family 4 protein [Sporosarcina saromensis]MDW0114015.1 glycosyltransferase family 4 protein [Sporosarcina saromensis]
MKILVVCQYYYPEPFRITDICEMLVKRGHEVTVVTGLPNYPEGKVLEEYRNENKKNEIKNGVKVIRTYEIGRGNSKLRLFLNYLSFTLSASLKTFNLRDKYDVVFVNQLSPVMMAIPAIIYKKKYKKKLLLYCLDLWPESLTVGGIKKGSLIFNLFLIISKRIYKSADKIVVTSSMFKKYFKDTFDFQTDSIGHIPQYAEDLFLLNKDGRVIESNKSDIYNFVFAGNIGEFQSVETIVQAANELKNHKNIRFHIVGDGSNLDRCKELASKYMLDNLVYYGRRPLEDMPSFYEMADAMLITLINNKNVSYTLPGKVQSYMAAGKPIIGAIDGETSIVIKDADCGLCCAAGKYIDFAKLILEFVNSDRKKQMGVNAQNYYIQNYNKNIFIERLENELNNLEVY